LIKGGGFAKDFEGEVGRHSPQVIHNHSKGKMKLDIQHCIANIRSGGGELSDLA